MGRALALSRQGQALSASASADAAELPIDALVMARDEADTGHYSRALASLQPVLAGFKRRGTDFLGSGLPAGAGKPVARPGPARAGRTAAAR